MSLVEKLVPVGDRFLVSLDEAESVSDLLITPESYKEPQVVGTVVGELGDGVPAHIQPGQRVVLSRYGGQDIGMEGELGKGRQLLKLVSSMDVRAFVGQP